MSKRTGDVAESDGSCKNLKLCDGRAVDVTEQQEVSEAIHSLLLLHEKPVFNDDNKISNEGMCDQAKANNLPGSESNPIVLGDFPDRPCPSGEDFFSQLPNEIILSIFNFLPRYTLFVKCALVCKRWNRLSEVKGLWNQIIIRHPGWIELFALEKILSFGLKKMTVRSVIRKMPICRSLPSNALMDAGNPRFFNLRELHLSEATMTEATLETLLSFFSELQKLSLPNVIISGLSCRHIAANQDLQVLDMSSVTKILSANVYGIFRSCTKLDTLRMYHNNIGAIFTLLSPHNPPNFITKLDISRQKTLQNYHIPVIFQHCPNLLILDISDCYEITSLAIHYLATEPNRLEVLFLNECVKIDFDEYVFSNLRSMKTLQYLEITSIYAYHRKYLNIPALAKRKNIPAEGSSFALFVFIYEMREKGIFLSRKQAKKRLAASKRYL